MLTKSEVSRHLAVSGRIQSRLIAVCRSQEQELRRLGHTGDAEHYHALAFVKCWAEDRMAEERKRLKIGARGCVGRLAKYRTRRLNPGAHSK